MKNKLIFAAGMAAGYVLGSRAGRESYEQLKTKADELWNNPKVQETVSDTTSTLKSKMPEVQEQAGDAVKKAKDTVTGALHRGDQAQAQDAKSGSAGSGSTASASTGPASTGPSGGNPAKVEDAPFQNQDEATRPDTV